MRGKPFNIAKNPKYDGYQRHLASMVYNYLDKKSSDGPAMLAKKSAVKSENISNKELAEELYKPIIRNFK